ncbi:MAG: lipopolysaccharide biosynthesis protein [Rudaea sp.]
MGTIRTGAAVRAGPRFRGQAARAVEHLRTPLYRNGYALLLSSGTSSILGFVFWVLAARFYPAETVGAGSALVSAMLFLSGLAQLSFISALVRYVALAGRGVYRFVGAAYLTSVVLSVVFAGIFILGIDRWSPALAFVSRDRLWALGFLVGTVAWSIFALQDTVLTGLRQTVWVPIENTISNAVKIILMLVLAGAAREAGIFASWIIPAAAAIPPVNWLIFRRIIPKHTVEARFADAGLDRLEVGRYVAGNFAASLFSLASTTLLPIIVTNEAGAVSNAYFYPAWMITTSLQLVAFNMTTSLTVEGALDQARLLAYARRVLLQILRLLVPLVALIVLAAPYVLLPFGREYAAEGAAVLRLLVLGTIPSAVLSLAVSIARVRSRSSIVAAIQAPSCLLLLGLSYLLLPTVGLIGVGAAWVASQSIVAGVLLLTYLRPIIK